MPKKRRWPSTRLRLMSHVSHKSRHVFWNGQRVEPPAISLGLVAAAVIRNTKRALATNRIFSVHVGLLYLSRAAVSVVIRMSSDKRSDERNPTRDGFGP
jgi:hypothetical protein